MYKSLFNKREVFKFKQFSRKSYSLFACHGREVIIGTLSVATLATAKADGISVEVERVDSTLQLASREITLDDIEVRGSRAPLTRGQAARMVTVLDREQIAQAPVQSVNDLLKYAVGADVRQRGPIGAQTDISLRGGTNEQITILLNGINICDPQTGHYSFDFPVDLFDIERIEVLEGPAGRVYGTSSLVGAINIVTRIASETSGEGRIEGGSFGYFNAGVRANVNSGQLQNQVSGSLTRSDGYSRNKAGGLNADYSGGKAFYQGKYGVNGTVVDWYAGMSVKSFGSNTFWSAKYDDQYDHTSKLYAGIKAEAECGGLHILPAVYWNRNIDRFELIRGSEEKVPYNYHHNDVFGININSYFDWALGRTALGAEFRNEDLISTTLGEPLNKPTHINGTNRDYTLGLNRSNLSFNFEHNILLRRFTLSAGFIAVKNTWNEMPFKVYPGIDASYRISDNLKVYASYNTSLRMPSVTELYYSVGGHKADKFLKPEKMKAVECGVKYAHSALLAQFAIYHHQGDDMIDWIMDMTQSEQLWESVNHTRLNALGFESSLHLDFHNLIPSQRILNNVSVAYSYIDQNKDLEKHLHSLYALEYLRHKLVASIRLDVTSNLYASLNYRFQERLGAYTSTDGTIRNYAPYSIFDIRLSWDKPQYSIYAEANNVFNERYVDFGNVQQPGTWVIGGITIRM